MNPWAAKCIDSWRLCVSSYPGKGSKAWNTGPCDYKHRLQKSQGLQRGFRGIGPKRAWSHYPKKWLAGEHIQR